MYNLVFDIGHNEFKFTEACLKDNPGCSVVAVDAIDFNKWFGSENEATKRLSSLNSEYGNKIQVYNRVVSDQEEQAETININTGATGKSTAMDMEEHMKQSRFFSGNKYILEEYNKVWTTHSGVTLSLEDYIFYLERACGSIKNALAEGTLPYYKQDVVPTITLDSLILKEGTPDLIKIDVEGYEHKVIHGMTKKANKICFEFAEEMDYSLYDSFSYLQTLGYEEFGICGFFEE